MRYTVRYRDYLYEYENLGDKKVLKTAEFSRWNDAYNEAKFLYANGVDEDVDVKDNEYDVIYSVREEMWY